MDQAVARQTGNTADIRQSRTDGIALAVGIVFTPAAVDMYRHIFTRLKQQLCA